jgi:nitroreductase
MFKDLVKKARSYRRFDHFYKIADDILFDIIDTARLTPSAANRQPIKYIVTNEPIKNEEVFPHLRWAAYLQDWEGPAKDERPTAYIVLLADSQFTQHVNFDPGIVAQTIQLAAAEYDIGACMIASFDKNKLKRVFNLDDNTDILLVIALGKPNETIILKDIDSNESIKYYRDEQDRHHVPKRKLSDLITKY